LDVLYGGLFCNFLSKKQKKLEILDPDSLEMIDESGSTTLLRIEITGGLFSLSSRDLQDARKKLNDMENKRKNSGEEAEKLRNALQEAVDKAKNASKEVSEVQTNYFNLPPPPTSPGKPRSSNSLY
jgi:hypothetical protein